MRVGSIVEKYKHDLAPVNESTCKDRLPIGAFGHVVSFEIDDETGEVWIELDIDPGFIYWIDNFREIEFPPALIEQITEALTVELV